MRGNNNAITGLIVKWFTRPDMKAVQLRKRAEWAFLCAPLFVVPLILFHDIVPAAVKIVLQVCWAGCFFIGYVLYAEHKKRGR
jgi:hypothetical protein